MIIQLTYVLNTNVKYNRVNNQVFWCFRLISRLFKGLLAGTWLLKMNGNVTASGS